MRSSPLLAGRYRCRAACRSRAPRLSAGVIRDDLKADAAEIGMPGRHFRRIQMASSFGDSLVLVTEGHLPYPFGREVTGYAVNDLKATLDKATAAGARVLSSPVTTPSRTTAAVQFPGGYIAEIHSAR